MFGLGGTEIGVLFLIILLVFGPSQIPKMARGLGQALREFKKAQRAEDGRKAMSDYEAAAAAERAKTARLRAARLARDAALPVAPPKPAAARKKPAKAPKGSSAKLSDWLDEREKGGRNT